MSNIIRKLAGISFILLLILTLGGCADKSGVVAKDAGRQQAGADNTAQEKAIMAKFDELLRQKEVGVPEILNYIDANIAGVSAGGASAMVSELEKVQQERLPGLQERIGDNQAVQTVLTKSYRGGLTTASLNTIENGEVKALLLKTLASGFKLETAEGMFFPVIDYSAYKKYHSAVTRDMAAYLDIMAVESDKPPAKDAALVISWAEILRRAAAQERFIADYDASAKAEAMRQLLQRYATFALYGANNTPLFSYDTGLMSPEAKKAYLDTVVEAKNGSFSKVMDGYLTVLKKNDYRLTEEVEEYRNKAVSEIR